MKPKTDTSPPSSGSSEHLPRRERRAIQAEIAWLHKSGYSDYQLAKCFGVSPGAINKVRLHAQIGRRVATAIYVATGNTPESLLKRHHEPPTPGCMVCDEARANAARAALELGETLQKLTLCPLHALVAVKALYG